MTKSAELRQFGNYFTVDENNDRVVLDSALTLTADGSSGGVKNYITNTGPSGQAYWIMSANANNGSIAGGKLVIGTDAVEGNNAAQARLTINESGNVGIGSTSPDYKLTVKDTTVTTGADQKYTFSVNRQNSDVGGLYLGMDGNADAVIAANNGDLRIGHDFSLTFNEHLRITTAGTIVVSNHSDYTGSATGAGHITPFYASNNSAQGGLIIGGGNSSDLNHAIFMRVGYDNTIDVTDFHQYGNFRFYNGGAIAGQTLKLKIDTSGHVTPGSNATQDLGSSSLAWRNIYTNDLHLSNEGHEEGNSVDGTKGNWTIQEGEEHLYIINNKNGKKYKFALEEIQ